MCSFRVRVHNCGHYHKSLKHPCSEAKSRKEVCERVTTEDASTSGSPHCGIIGCDKKPNLKREGPGTRLTCFVAILRTNVLTPANEAPKVPEPMVDSTRMTLTGMSISRHNYSMGRSPSGYRTPCPGTDGFQARHCFRYTYACRGVLSH